METKHERNIGRLDYSNIDYCRCQSPAYVFADGIYICKSCGLPIESQEITVYMNEQRN